jgi:hypothetical protein
MGFVTKAVMVGNKRYESLKEAAAALCVSASHLCLCIKRDRLINGKKVAKAETENRAKLFIK